MHLEYDSDANAIYVSLVRDEQAVERTVELDGERSVDYAADGTAIGVELLSVSQGVRLTDLPNATEIRELLNLVRAVAVAS